MWKHLQLDSYYCFIKEGNACIRNSSIEYADSSSDQREQIKWRCPTIECGITGMVSAATMIYKGNQPRIILSTTAIPLQLPNRYPETLTKTMPYLVRTLDEQLNFNLYLEL
jgi:hypothetical protein